MASKLDQRTSAAIDRLASMVPFGALSASTQPDVFLGEVAAELASLRRVHQAAERFTFTDRDHHAASYEKARQELVAEIARHRTEFPHE